MNYPFKKPEGFFYYYYFLGKITFQSKSVNKTFSKKCDGVCVCIYIYIYIYSKLIEKCGVSKNVTVKTFLKDHVTLKTGN